ncbi:hypothetical protein PHISCL_09968 [Aspergillus sclerotialis]|uniref:Uncharacterized protein n=1 Tax=Aspergillus sclerotialis TaxID=2070753 RepID=A0A3A2ZED4_9EURO|nr:hypothetical protein PHISCL_09968 [Aspergillus sclerotialis]
MTVQTMPPTPTRASANLARKPSLNKRLPPLADRNSLPHRLTGLSRQKLAREATAPDPDVRRCLAHFRLHVASIEWTNKNVTNQISSFELEEDDDEEDRNEKEREDEKKEKEDEEKQHANEEKKDDSNTPPQQESSKDVLHVSFEVPPPTPPTPTIENDPSTDQSSSSTSKEENALDRGRNCIEKPVQKKNFWSSTGQCVPVSIAS